MSATRGVALRPCAAFVAGAATAVAVWLLLVPWDLSEIDAAGTPIPGGGGDANAGRITLVAIIVFAAGVALVFGNRTRPRAAMFTGGGSVTWALLFGWRTGSSQVTGANMFIIPLVILVIPAAILLPATVRTAARRRQARADLPT